MNHHVTSGAGIGMIFGYALGSIGAGLVLGAAAGLLLQKLRARDDESRTE